MVLSQEALAVLRMLVLYMSRRWACLSGTAAQRQGSHDAPQQEDGVPSGNSRHSRLSLWADMWTLAVNCFTFLGRNGIVLFTLVRHVNCELFHFSPFFVFTAPWAQYSWIVGEEGAGDKDFVLRRMVWFFLISSGRSSVDAFLRFHNSLPVCADPAAKLLTVQHRRRMETEGKANFVPSVWETKFVQFLAALNVFFDLKETEFNRFF